MKNNLQIHREHKIKKHILFLLLTLNFSLFTFNLKAQPPQGFSYQAIITDEFNMPLANTAVGMLVTLLEGGEEGRPVYIETHTTTTDAIGHVSLVVGAGNVVSGNFASIVWGAGEYWVRVKTDPNGGTNYTISGTSRLMSVPFAMVALNALSGGEPGPQGPPGEDGILPDGSQLGAVPYWDGNEWVVSENHLFYDGLNVGIGTTQPDASAVLDLHSTSRGLLIPRMTGAQRDAIPSPPEGLMIFNTSENCFNYYTGIAWVQNCGLSSNQESNVFPPQQGSGVGNVQSLDITTDQEGNIIVTGRYGNTVVFGTETISSPVSTAFVVKYDPTGNVLWARSAQGNSIGGYGVAADAAGNVYITGSFSGSITFGSVTLTSQDGEAFIVKYDPNGNVLWARASVSSGTYNFTGGYGIAIDVAGNVYVTGQFNEQVAFGSQSLTEAGFMNMFVVKYDTNGNALWVRSSSGFNALGIDIAIDASGDILLTGFFSGTTSFNSISLTSLGGTDSFITRYDANGNLIWAVSGGGANNVGSENIAVDAAGNIFIAGYFGGTAVFGSETITSAGDWDGFIVKSDLSGNFLWARNIGGGQSDNVSGIATDPSGNVVVTGQFRGTASFGGQTLTSGGQSDAFVIKYDPDGNVIWVQQGSGPSNVFGSGAATTPLGDAVVTGGFRQTAWFGNMQLESAGDFDMFVVRYSASGVPNVSMPNFGVSGFYDHDSDPTNELITGFQFSTPGNILSVMDAGGTRNIDLTPIASKWELSGNDIFRTTGNVGIGTNNPRGRLNVSLNSGVTSASGIEEYPLMISYPSNANNQETGIAFRISAQQNPSQTPGAAITHLRTGAGSVGHLLFKTKESGDSDPLSERMRITGTGNVGIGTSAPEARLHVVRTNSSSSPQLRIQNSSTTGFARFRLTNEAHERYWDIAAGGTNNYLDFFQSGGAGSILTLRGDSESVGVRTINPAFTLHVNGEAGKPGGGSWSNASDARLKTEVKPLKGSLENLLKLNGVTFQYNDHKAINELPGLRIGMIAQEVAEIFPDWVHEGNDGYLRLTYRGFEAVVVEAMRELKEEKDQEIKALHQRLEKLETLLQSLVENGNGDLHTKTESASK